LFVTLLSAVFLRQPITGYKIAALLMTVVGILFTIGMDSGGYFLGIILAISAAIISTFEVVVAVALAIIILGETLTLPKIFGGCLVISAVIILARSEYETARAKISHSISR
jgi:drug/metabolite transporter (DMT)-like permease